MWLAKRDIVSPWLPATRSYAWQTAEIPWSTDASQYMMHKKIWEQDIVVQHVKRQVFWKEFKWM